MTMKKCFVEQNVEARRDRGFTLIELLVVIVIIALLASLIVPAISLALDKAKEARAMREITDLQGAIRNFYSEYHYMPYGNGFASSDEFINPSKKDDENTAMGTVLSALLGKDKKLNPKEIVFLDLDKSSIEGAKTYEDVYDKLGYHKDPWKRGYGIIMDMDRDDRITIGDTIHHFKVGVYSLGSPRKKWSNYSETELKSW